MSASHRLDLVPATERATHLIGLYLETAGAELGITQAEAHILGRLARGGATSPNELHRLFGHKRSTLTSVLDRLESHGYTTRTVNPDDRRSFIVALTPAGKRAAAVVDRAVSALEHLVEKRVGKRDLDGFAATLAALEIEAAVPGGSAA